MVVAYEIFDAPPAEDTVVCRCLGVTETMLRHAMSHCPLRTIRDVSRETGAGDGCTSCHTAIRQFLAKRLHAGS